MDDLENMEVHRTNFLYEGSNRIYPREEMETALTKLLPRIEAGAVRGEYGSPADKAPALANLINNRLSTIDEGYVSHQVKKIWIDDEGVVRATITPTGPFAKVMLGQIASGRQPVFGMRALTRDVLVDGVLQPEPGSLNIISFDLVNMV